MHHKHTNQWHGITSICLWDHNDFYTHIYSHCNASILYYIIIILASQVKKKNWPLKYCSSIYHCKLNISGMPVLSICNCIDSSTNMLKWLLFFKNCLERLSFISNIFCTYVWMDRRALEHTLWKTHSWILKWSSSVVENNAIMLTNSNVSSSATTYRLKIVLPSSFTLIKLVLYNSIIRSIAIETSILVSFRLQQYKSYEIFISSENSNVNSALKRK